MSKNYAGLPANAAILKMLSRPKGATAAEIAKARNLQPHTVRAVISRLGTIAKVKIARAVDEKRGLVYRAKNGRAR